MPVQIRTVRDAFDRTLTGRRFSLLLIVAFGLAALVLATFGVYGLVAYVVAQRTKEMGTRMALGATHSDLLRLIVGRGCMLALVGSGLGVAATVPLTQVMKSMFFATSPTDPAVVASVIGLPSRRPRWRAICPHVGQRGGEPIVSLRTQ